ncbi:putative oxidoreductase YhhX [bioreactor metagenome]
MNDYFDLDFFYGTMKISIKSSYFRIKERPSFVVYGKKGMFVKQTKDRQEEHLKMFYMPDNADFGIDLPEHFGVLTYMDDKNIYREEKVTSEIGDYSRVYDGIYETLINGAEKLIKDEETILQMQILENGIRSIQENEEKE